MGLIYFHALLPICIFCVLPLIVPAFFLYLLQLLSCYAIFDAKFHTTVFSHHYFTPLSESAECFFESLSSHTFHEANLSLAWKQSQPSTQTRKEFTSLEY